MKHATDLGKDKVPFLVLKLAIPSMIAQFVTVLYSIIDRMFIGNIGEIGDIALAGVGVCGPIVTLLTSFGTLVGLGGSILMAMRMGAGQKKEAESILAHSFAMLVAFSAVLTLVFLLSKKYLLNWFGASPLTFPYADTYMTIYTAGTFFALMAIGLNYFITCQGFPAVGMCTVLIGAFTNIVLDPVFIFVFDMGVAGAAWATVIAQLASCSFAFCFLVGKKVPIRITPLKREMLSKNITCRILSLGLSPFLILATDSVIIIVMNTVLQHYGGPTEGDLLITCATIVQSYMMLITGPMLGISSGTQAILSYNLWGKGYQTGKKSGNLYSTFMSLFYFPDVSAIQNCPTVFYWNFYQRPRTYGFVHLGNWHFHSYDCAPKFSICFRRWLHCTWKKQNSTLSVFVPARETMCYLPLYFLYSIVLEVLSTHNLWLMELLPLCQLLPFYFFSRNIYKNRRFHYEKTQKHAFQTFTYYAVLISFSLTSCGKDDKKKAEEAQLDAVSASLSGTLTSYTGSQISLKTKEGESLTFDNCANAKLELK